MRIIVDIAHPAHVHFFKNFIWEMQKRGHDILITAGDKDVTLSLLESYGFNYKFTCKRTSGYKLIAEILKRDLQMLKFVKEYKPDIVMGIASTIAAHVSKITNVKSIVFTDTEHTKLGDMITYPFSDAIITPSCYKKNIGKKQIRYNGYHELAYLHPNYFTPNPAVLDELGLTEDDNIFLIRFAAFDASHDEHTENFKKEYVASLIKKLEPYGKIIISSEKKLDEYLEKYQYNLPPDKYHDVLYYSKLYIGEGSTSAEEAAILGTPSLHFERLNVNGVISCVTPLIGLLDELQNKYGLVYSYCTEHELLNKIDNVLHNITSMKKQWIEKRDRLLKDKIDVTAFIVWFVENYPESFDKLKENPELQKNFNKL